MSEEKRNRPKRTAGPTREGDSLADVVEMLLDKGVVINADIAVTVGETELLGIHLRAALASFETAAEYGLQFPDGTDMRRVEEASGRTAMHTKGGSPISVRSPGTSGISPAPHRDANDGSEDDAADESDADESDAGGSGADESEADGSEADDENDADGATGGGDEGQNEDENEGESQDGGEAP